MRIAWSFGDSQLPSMAVELPGGGSTEKNFVSNAAVSWDKITDQDSMGILAMSSVHGTHASLRGESIDASNNAGTRTCCVHVKLEGKFAMGSSLPNRACAFSLAASDETIVLEIFCVHPWSGCANPAEEAESSNGEIE